MPDQSHLVDHRLPLGYAIASTGVDDEGAHERAAGIDDDPGRDEGDAGIDLGVQQRTIGGVLLFELPGRVLPLQEALIFLPQSRIFRIDVEEIVNRLDTAIDRRDRLRQDRHHRRQSVVDHVTHALDQREICFAQQHQRERANYQDAERETLRQYPYR